MKVNDIDKLRSQLYKNLKAMWFNRCETTELLSTEFNNLMPENVGTHEIRKLYNPMVFYKCRYADKGYKMWHECELYLTLDDYYYHIYVKDVEKQCFRLVSFDLYDDYENRTVFMMEMAVRIERYLNEYGIGGVFHKECYEVK